MLKQLVLTIFLAFCLLAAPARAGNYPLGTMTCDDIGQSASEFMSWRTDGVSREAADSRLDARTFKDPVEKKNLAIILGLVYGSYGRNWTVESAGSVMKTDCESGRPK
jgi:hypothetical protein